MGTAEAMGQYYEVPVGDLFNKYEAWGIGAGIETMKKTAFGKALRNRGLTQKRGSHGSPRLWRGLRVTKGDKSSVFSPASTFTSLNTETLSPLVTRDEVGQEVLEDGTDAVIFDEVFGPAKPCHACGGTGYWQRPGVAREDRGERLLRINW